MKKVLIFFIITILSSCKKNDDSFVNYFDLEKKDVLQTPDSLSEEYFYDIKINGEGEIFGRVKSMSNSKSTMERFFIDKGKTSVRLTDLSPFLSFGKPICYDDGLKIVLPDMNYQLLKSIDYGNTFFNYGMTTNTYQTNPFFINSDIGFYVESLCPGCWSNKIILHKIENGTDLVISTFQPPNLYSVENVCFLNENIGWVVTRNSSSNSSQYEIFKTIDSGLSWVSVCVFNNTSKLSDGYGASFGMMQALSENVLIVSSNYISQENKYYFISTDSGVTWLLIDLSAKIDESNYKFVRNFHMLSETVGFAVTSSYPSKNSYNNQHAKGYLYKTIDGGNTWNKVTGEIIYAWDVYFIDENIGVVSADGIIQKTIDGGKTFELIMYPKEGSF